MADGTLRGFRVVFGGRGWRVPIFEQVSRMSLNTMEVAIAIRNAYSQGGIPLNVDAIANVKISSDQGIVGNAIERFLGRDPNEIRRVAKETLEGHLRGVLARLSPEEVNENRLKFAEELSMESEQDLSKLGIHLDTFKIQHISDDTHYLDSIGRESIANVKKTAEIAESDAKREAELAEAENSARANVSQATAEANIARLRNELRRVQAEVEAEVQSEEQRTAAAAREARAKAEQELQRLRAELEAIRLHTDTVLPAEAQRKARELQARGDAAITREQGVATAESMALLTSAWREAGPSALAISLIQDLDKILGTAVTAVQKIELDNVQIIGSSNSSTLANFAGSYAAVIDNMLGTVKSVTGIDVAGTVSAAGAKSSEDQSK